MITEYGNSKETYKRVISILKRYGVTKVKVFGSYARGEETPYSDLDIIVEFSQRKSLMDLVGIEQEIHDELGINVELVNENYINPHLIYRIREEMQVIYE